MHEDPRSATNGSPDTTIGPAERWRLRALDIVRGRLPGRRWLAFAAAVEERHLAVFVRSSLKRRDQGQGLAAGAQDDAVRLATGDLSPMGGARGAAGMRPASAADPARPHLPDRRAGRPASWPEPEADRPVAGRELRAAVPRRPVGSDPQGAEAGARIDHRWSAATLHGLARTLDPYVQGWLSRLLDLRIPAVRIHTGQAADATARRFNADAVSLGPDIMFRAGRFAPDTASGLGLLGHELTHVAHTRLDRSAEAPERGALAREEFAALENERRVLQHATGRPAATARIAPIPRVPPSRMVTRAPTPRAAAVDRGVAPPPGASDAVSPSPDLSAEQLGALKEAIYRDLIDRIRTDFERGA